MSPISPPSESTAGAGRPPGGRSWARSWRTWLGLLISAVFLAIAFRGQRPGDVLALLGRADLRWLAPALVLYFAGVGVRAVRWSVLLRPVVPLSPRDVFPLVLAGYTANNILPLRTGELVRAFLLGQRYGVRKTATVATIAIERLCDGLTMLAFVAAATSVVPLPAELRRIALLAGALFAAVLLGLVVVLFGGTRRDRLVGAALRPLAEPWAKRVERMVASFVGGLGVLSRRGDLALVLILSLVAWGFEASMYWAIARGFDPALRAAMTPAAALLTTGVANLATLVPAAPGYVGTFEAGVVLALHGALGVGRDLALSYALLVHAALWFPVTAWGAITWWRFHLSIDRVRHLEDEAARRPGGKRRGRWDIARPPRCAVRWMSGARSGRCSYGRPPRRLAASPPRGEGRWRSRP